jgi:hypothetical protein
MPLRKDPMLAAAEGAIENTCMGRVPHQTAAAAAAAAVVGTVPMLLRRDPMLAAVERPRDCDIVMLSTNCCRCCCRHCAHAPAKGPDARCSRRHQRD